jgi:hypothetical protein
MVPVYPVFAQELFTEGTIKYKVTILAPPNPDDPTATRPAQNGTYVLYIKNKKVRKDLILDGGFRSTNLADYRVGKNIILKTVAGIKYALETDVQDELEEQKRFVNGKFLAGAESKKIGNILSQEGMLTYSNGEHLHFYFDPEYKMELSYVFEQFPELEGIPAEFELNLSGGYKTRFELVSVTAEPIRNSIFRVPEGYRIISKKEYEQLAK